MMKAEQFLSDVVKQDVKPFKEEYGEKVVKEIYQSFMDDILDEKIPIPPKKLGPYKLPYEILLCPFQYFVEMIEANCNPETYDNYEIVAACFYRKDWTKPFNAIELMETAEWFKSQPFLYSLWGVHLLEELGKRMRETYPDLYIDGEESTDRERMHVLINGLAKDDVTKYKEIGNTSIADVMTYLSVKKEEATKHQL